VLGLYDNMSHRRRVASSTSWVRGQASASPCTLQVNLPTRHASTCRDKYFPPDRWSNCKMLTVSYSVTKSVCIACRCNAYRHLVPWLHKTCLHRTEESNVASSSNQWMEAPRYRATTQIMWSWRRRGCGHKLKRHSSA
jgi:hypothetical protein